MNKSTPPNGHTAIYVSWRNGIPMALALRRALERKGMNPVIYLAPRLDVSDLPDVSGTTVARVRRLDRILDNAASVMVQSLTSLSLGDNDRVRATFRPSSRISSIAHSILKRMPRLSARTLNRVVRVLTMFLVSDVFHTDVVYAIAPVAFPVLVNRRGTNVTAVIDSWDQPIRRTAGFVADSALAWNLDLADDWRRVQGCRSTGTVPATRLEYALTIRGSTGSGPKADGYFLYPMATTANRLNWYRGELLLVEAVCAATADSGRELLLKPKPNSRSGDLEAFAARYSHVRVGEYLATSTSDDWLITPSYDRTRLSELAGAYCVISTATTFALDAATAGVPILQLDVRHMAELGGFADAAHNSHLVRHLYPRTAKALVAPGTLSELSEVIRSIPQLEDDMVDASQALAEWIWHEYLP